MRPCATKLGKGESSHNVKPFIETLRVTNPVRQSRASSREASLAWGRVTVTAKHRLPMAITRAKLVDLTVTRWYHCVSRCVRKAFLLGEGDDNRKLWLENRFGEFAEIFAVAVGGFSDVKLVEYTGRLFRQEKASTSVLADNLSSQFRALREQRIGQSTYAMEMPSFAPARRAGFDVRILSSEVHVLSVLQEISYN